MNIKSIQIHVNKNLKLHKSKKHLFYKKYYFIRKNYSTFAFILEHLNI